MGGCVWPMVRSNMLDILRLGVGAMSIFYSCSHLKMDTVFDFTIHPELVKTLGQGQGSFFNTENKGISIISHHRKGKIAQTEEEHDVLVGLFEQGITDYTAPDLWLEYLQYAIRWINTVITIIKQHSFVENGVVIYELYNIKDL